MSDGVVLPVHAAALHANGTFSAIPHGASPIIVEIGTSDRDTLDVELLPRLPSAFLVSFEPLIDKYARALARRKPSDKVKDGWEPLGMHHERGLILPMAVGPVSANASMAGELQSFHVARNAGCSSLLNINHAPYRGPLRRAASERAPQVFGLLCRPGAERRQVWVVPLSRALQWIGHQVDFLKVDAQGMDLRVVLSGGSLLRRHVRHMVLEVVGDECAPLYHGQPRCSHVVKRLAAEGFEPPTPVQCRTAFPFASTKHLFCEMDLLFVRRPALDGDEEPVSAGAYADYDHRGAHGCTELYNASTPEVRHSPPKDRAVAVLHPHGGVAYVSGAWEGRSTHPRGLPVICPRSCFFQFQKEANAKEEIDVKRFGGRCPF
jgi:FkbM family methyltransferase